MPFFDAVRTTTSQGAVFTLDIQNGVGGNYTNKWNGAVLLDGLVFGLPSKANEMLVARLAVWYGAFVLGCTIFAPGPSSCLFADITLSYAAY